MPCKRGTCIYYSIVSNGLELIFKRIGCVSSNRETAKNGEIGLAFEDNPLLKGRGKGLAGHNGLKVGLHME